MPEPLPAEVVSDWWDYFVDVVGVVYGIATAAAFLVAALAFRRQVGDASRAQAIKVTMRVFREDNGYTILDP
jgi:hypothetical protein